MCVVRGPLLGALVVAASCVPTTKCEAPIVVMGGGGQALTLHPATCHATSWWTRCGPLQITHRPGRSIRLTSQRWPPPNPPQPAKAKALLWELATLAGNGQGGIGESNYFLGGAMQDVSAGATAVHPAARKAVWNIMTMSDTAHDLVRKALPNDVTGVSGGAFSDILVAVLLYFSDAVICLFMKEMSLSMFYTRRNGWLN
eukprot:1194319-Prorocentrum_minimum.AAC.2